MPLANLVNGAFLLAIFTIVSVIFGVALNSIMNSGSAKAKETPNG